MGLPDSAEARLFYRSAKQRFEDARFLMPERTTGAVYLAGYSVECMLKALILALVPAKRKVETVAEFRGARAHDYDWLRARYFENGGPPFPAEIAKAFALVNTWDTELRYRPGMLSPREADAFLLAVEAILVWADGRL